MPDLVTRRSILGLPLAAPLGAVGVLVASQPVLATADIYEGFPSQDRTRVRDTVLYAHSDVDKVRALVQASPALANAAIDWGFGDWESAIGAASHMGRRDIAAVLLEHGARPDIFTHAMLGHLDAVRGAASAMPGIHEISGPHGIPLLSHAKAGGDASKLVVEYLESLPRSAASAAVPEFDPATYVGKYKWGANDGQRFEILARDGQMSFKYGERFPRNLFAIGEHEFYPGGARGVRIRFQVESGRAVRATVHDPEVIVSGARVD